MKRACLALLLGACAPRLVDVRERVPGAIFDIRYATPNNFMRQPIYLKDRCLLRPDVADRLERVANRLADENLRLVVWDCYRPLRVQKKMWARVPDERYVANPATGSNHNRGAAVDVTLAEPSGRPLPMPTDYDDFTTAAHLDALAPEPERSNRERLRRAMEAEGFVPLTSEWWHYSDPDALDFEILDEPL